MNKIINFSSLITDKKFFPIYPHKTTQDPQIPTKTMKEHYHKLNFKAFQKSVIKFSISLYRLVENLILRNNQEKIFFLFKKIRVL